MALVETHAPGSLCWIELGATDQNAAKEFYTSLMGWTANDFPIGPDEVYTMFSLKDRNTGACYAVKPGNASTGRIAPLVTLRLRG
jgi:hypothetical protein